MTAAQVTYSDSSQFQGSVNNKLLSCAGMLLGRRIGAQSQH